MSDAVRLLPPPDFLLWCIGYGLLALVAALTWTLAVMVATYALLGSWHFARRRRQMWEWHRAGRPKPIWNILGDRIISWESEP